MVVKTVRYADMGLENPVAVIGFPSIGLVSSIAANYYIGQLDMEPVAGMSSPSMPPYCLVNNGSAYPPVRFYGRKHTTKTGRDVLMALSEYAPKPEDCYELSQAIISYLKYMGCKDIICLEGIPRNSPEDEPVACPSGPEAAKMARKSGLRVMESGMIRGISGVLLAEANGSGMNATALLVPGNPAMPDPGAAVEFVKPLSKMVPGLRVKTKPLIAEAEEIQRKIEAEEEKAEESVPQFYG